MDNVLSGLSWEVCLYYLDDIIIFSRDWEEHLHRLRMVFLRLREANLRLGHRKMRPGKYVCNFPRTLGVRGGVAAGSLITREYPGNLTSH